jgi:signal transduction histidine kinase/ActR/RegA family two-component response regulator
MKLRSYLMLFALATLLPIAIFAVVVGALLIESQRDTFRRAAEERTLAVLNTVEVKLKSAISTVEALAVSPTLDNPDTAGFRAIATSVLATQSDWSTINLALPTGQQVMNVNRPAGVSLPAIPTEDASVERVIQTRKPAVGDMVLGPTTARWDFAVRVPIVRDGAVKYILSAVVNPASIYDLLMVQSLPPGWIGVVLDRNDRIVASTLGAKGVGQLAPRTLRNVLADSQSGWFRGNTMDGTDVYSLHHRSEATGWAFAMDIPAQAVEQAQRRAQGMLAVGLLTALAFALSLAVVVGERISTPISSLAEATKAMGHGQSLTLPTDVRVNEVGTLIRTLREAEQAIRDRQKLVEREKEALQAADRSKDEFLAMLSHELRTPLAALTTAAHVLRFAANDADKAAQARGVVERQTKHMARLVEDLLDVSRVNIGKARLQREAFDLGETVENLIASWQASKRFERHRVSHAIAPVWINADRTRIEQIVSNLLDNALKFTPAGGGIDLTLRQAGGEAVLQVADEGVGLSAGAMERIFDLFAQGEQGLDRRKRGMGIGLALVKRLSEMHGGTVSVSSEGPDQGATFTVRLPAVSQPYRHAERSAGDEPVSARRILIIEDNDDTRTMLRAALALSGHEVLEGHDGATGLAKAAAEMPDIVLIDIGLPDIDGYEVARRLRASPSNGRVPLIALSGYGQAADLKRAFEAGFDSHLTKPVAVEQLHGIITAFNEQNR